MERIEKIAHFEIPAADRGGPGAWPSMLHAHYRGMGVGDVGEVDGVWVEPKQCGVRSIPLESGGTALLPHLRANWSGDELRDLLDVMGEVRPATWGENLGQILEQLTKAREWLEWVRSSNKPTEPAGPPRREVFAMEIICSRCGHVEQVAGIRLVREVAEVGVVMWSK